MEKRELGRSGLAVSAIGMGYAEASGLPPIQSPIRSKPGRPGEPQALRELHVPGCGCPPSAAPPPA